MTNILIQGAYGNGNSGDDALLLSLLHDLSPLLPGAKIRVLSVNPTLTRAVSGNQVHQVLHGRMKSARHFLPNLLAAFRTDLYLFGGGGILGDVTHSLIKGLLLRARIVRARGGRAMIYAVGCDPIVRPENQALMQQVGRIVSVITVRDDASRRYMIEAGVPENKVQTTADPAFSLPAASPDTVSECWQAEDVPPHAGPRFGIAPAFPLTPLERQMIAQVADELAAEFDAQIVLLPFERENDLAAAEEIARHMQRKAVVIRGHYPPQQLKAMAASLDLLIGMRFHALIFAASGTVPLVAISYVPKIESVMHQLGLNAQVLYTGWMVRQQKRHPALTDTYLRTIAHSAWTNRETLQATIAARRPDLQRLASENARLAARLVNR